MKVVVEITPHPDSETNSCGDCQGIDEQQGMGWCSWAILFPKNDGRFSPIRGPQCFAAQSEHDEPVELLREIDAVMRGHLINVNCHGPVLTAEQQQRLRKIIGEGKT